MMLAAALEYAARGWLVFPLHTPLHDGCSCKRADCQAIGKHPRTINGLSDATTNEIQIRAWWTKWPDANIGIATGIQAGIIVVDLDNKRGIDGGGNLTALATKFGGMPETLTAITGSGEHLYFQSPCVPVKNSASKLADGVDIRGDGGYVVGPPSLHANGKRYDWKDPEQPVADLPDWMLTGITMKKEGIKTTQVIEHNPFTDAPTVNEGNRNDTLYKLGCALRGQHAKERDDIVAVLLTYNDAKCVPPLDEREVIQIADSVCEHPAELRANKSGARLEQSPLFWFQFNTREWFANQNVMMMNDAQTGWYIRLLALAWDGGGFLTADRDKLWKLAKAKSRKAFDKDCDLVLAEFEEVVIDGETRLRHPKLAADHVKTLELWMKKKGAAEVSRASRLPIPERNNGGATASVPQPWG